MNITNLDVHTTVGEAVADRPARSRVLERLGIDYCCGGRQTVEEASIRLGLDPETVLAELLADDLGTPDDGAAPVNMSMTELADHIEATHHSYLRAELPRLAGLADKVVAAHGQKYPWVEEVQFVQAALAAELYPHMLKEEQILFPLIRQLDGASTLPPVHCGTVNNPIHVMEHEHDNAGAALRGLRTLTNGFAVPEGACNTFRAWFDGLAALELDLHAHIHKENNVLVVGAAETERELRSAG